MSSPDPEPFTQETPSLPDNVRQRVIVSLLLIPLFLAAGAGIFAILANLKKDPKRVDKVPPRTAVRVVVAKRGPYREVLQGYGSARALRASDVAAEVSGMVTSISPRLEAGASVAEGEELIRLDQRDFRERVSSADARRKQAAAALDRLRIDIESVGRRLALAKEDLDAASRELERIRGLVTEGVETRSALDRQVSAKSAKERLVAELESREATAKNDLVSAEADVDAAQATFAQARNDLERTVIRSPYAGRIEARRAELGARVAPGSLLFRIVDLSRVEVPVAIGASRYGEVAPGAKARVRLTEGGDVVWEGTVSRLSPSVNSTDRTFLVYLEVAGSAGAAPVPPGAFVLAEIDGLRHADVIPVPRGAFVEDRLYLAAPAEDGEAVIREVRPEVRRLLPDVALLSGGVEPGERIVVTSLEQIAAGSRVILVRKSAPGSEDGSPARPGGGGVR